MLNNFEGQVSSTAAPTNAEHPAVQKFLRTPKVAQEKTALDHDWLRELCLSFGADDVGFVSIESPHLERYKAKIQRAFPRTKALISFIVKMNYENVRNPARSVANLEFHQSVEETDHIARKLVSELAKRGVRATNPATGFPMEIDRFGEDEIWVVGHKPVAVAAGLGQMGINRNVIHPKFGNFILLGTVLLDAEISAYSQPIDYNPCFSCKLCVAACPVGAIHSDGYFNFSACLTHNYREFMGGFNDWVGQIADSSSSEKYFEKTSSAETASVWQSLSFGPNYKAAYCMAVCPAGDDVIGQFLSNKAEFLDEIVKPLQKKEEIIYVSANTDAEEYVLKRFPNKTVKRIGSGLRARSIKGFLRALRSIFQPEKSRGHSVNYHFVFHGAENIEATVSIADMRVKVNVGKLEGKPDLRVDADSSSWLKFLNKKSTLPVALLTGKIKLKGSPKHLQTFGKCFVS